MKQLAVAIDGPSGAGKSTVARAAAQKLGFVYVDTGALYRAIGCTPRRRGLRWRIVSRFAGCCRRSSCAAL